MLQDQRERNRLPILSQFTARVLCVKSAPTNHPLCPPAQTNNCRYDS
jgi:hypothetical protein